MVHINQAAVRGEPGTGYENPGKLGEFTCRNCEYFDTRSSSCGQKDMVRLSKRGRLPSGRVYVEPKGCCEYVNRMGRYGT